MLAPLVAALLVPFASLILDFLNAKADLPYLIRTTHLLKNDTPIYSLLTNIFYIGGPPVLGSAFLLALRIYINGTLNFTVSFMIAFAVTFIWVALTIRELVWVTIFSFFSGVGVVAICWLLARLWFITTDENLMARKMPNYERAVLVTIFVAVLAVPIGSVFYDFITMFQNPIFNKRVVTHIVEYRLFEIIRFFIHRIPEVFFLGGPPAFMSALWVGVRTYLRGGFGYIEAMLTGFITSFIYYNFFMFSFMAPIHFWHPFLILLTQYCFIAICSAIVCRFLLARMSLIEPRIRLSTPEKGSS